MAHESLPELVRRLRELEPSVTWHEVFSDIPAHWVAGRPETWTTPYHPFGRYDHQSLPTGPAIHVAWPRSTDRGCLDRLVGAGRAAGWPIYGAGLIEIENPEWPTLDAFVILYYGVS